MFAHLPSVALAVGLPEHPSLGENIFYQLAGLLVVMSALAFLALAIKLAGALFAARPEPPKEPFAAAAARAAQPKPGQLPPDIFVVIAAAAETALGAQGRILSIQEAGQPRMDARLLAWSMEGRRQIFSSHQPH